MKKPFALQKKVIGVIGTVFVFALIGFADRSAHEHVIRDVRITLENNVHNHVLEEDDVFRLMQLQRENLLGASLDRINLRQLEQRILTNPWVYQADIYADLKGTLFVEVKLRKALARIFLSGDPGAFVATDGTRMPVPRGFALRTLLISGPKADDLMKTDNLYQDAYGTDLMRLLEFIQADDFLRAQIAQLIVDTNGKIRMIPQVGNQIIEFGRPVDAEEKLKKIKIFYTRILPTRGWNRYHRVNVEYDKQIVAE